MQGTHHLQYNLEHQSVELSRPKLREKKYERFTCSYDVVWVRVIAELAREEAHSVLLLHQLVRVENLKRVVALGPTTIQKRVNLRNQIDLIVSVSVKLSNH